MIFLQEGNIVSPKDLHLKDQSQLDWLVDRRILEKRNDGNLKLTFVGHLGANGHDFMIMPKVVSTDDCLGISAKVFHSIKKYQKHTVRFGLQDIVMSSDSGIRSTLDIASKILHDYSLHGIWQQALTQYQDNGEGNVDWRRTIDRKYPVLSKGNLVYPEVITKRKIRSMDSDLTEIHRYCVAYCADHFGEILGVKIHVGRPNPRISRSPHERLATAVRSVLPRLFRDRDVALFTLIIELLSATSFKDNSVEAYGSTSYHAVWEDVCKRIIGHQEALHSRFTTLPEWKDDQNDDAVLLRENSPLVPDILRLIENNESRNLLILDAKYYNFASSITPLRVNNPIPTSDIAKQLFYQMQATAVEPETEVSNAFLIPYYSDERQDSIIRYTGITTLNNSSDAKSVRYILIDFSIALALYVGNTNNQEINNSLIDSN